MLSTSDLHHSHLCWCLGLEARAGVLSLLKMSSVELCGKELISDPNDASAETVETGSIYTAGIVLGSALVHLAVAVE